MWTTRNVLDSQSLNIEGIIDIMVRRSCFSFGVIPCCSFRVMHFMANDEQGSSGIFSNRQGTTEEPQLKGCFRNILL